MKAIFKFGEDEMKRPWFMHYAPHVPHTLQYPSIPVHEFLIRTAVEHPNNIAMTINDQDTTYAELNDKVNRFARILQEQGVKKGDRVALILINSPTYVISFFALMKLGAIAANLSVGITGDELAACLNNAGARVAITLDLFAQNLYNVISKTSVNTVILHSVFGLEKKLAHGNAMHEPLIYSDLMTEVTN